MFKIKKNFSIFSLFASDVSSVISLCFLKTKCPIQSKYLKVQKFKLWHVWAQTKGIYEPEQEKSD